MNTSYSKRRHIQESNMLLEQRLLDSKYSGYETVNTISLYKDENIFDFVIREWLSPDEKYCIFLDDLYDIPNKVKLGNIWENFDNFKFFIKHSFEVSTTVPKQIKESVFNTLNSLLITESKQNLTNLKPFLKQALHEQGNILGDLANWGKEQVTGAVKGVGDFLSKSYEGVKKVVGAISKGEWSQVLDLLKKGSLYVARKIRSALYTPIGVVLDAILVASGVGVALKALPWAIVVALDVYEYITGEFEDPELSAGWRFFYFMTDIMGLVLSGVFAKTNRQAVVAAIKRFGKTDKGLKTAVQQTPALKTALETVGSNLSKVDGLMKQAQASLQKSSPTMYKFMSGIMGGISKFINKVFEFAKWMLSGVSNVLSAPGKITTKLGGGAKTAAAANAIAPAAAMGAFQEYKGRKSSEEINSKIASMDVDFDLVDI
jgi:hypothetical protein